MYQYSNSLIRQFPSLVTGNAAVGVQATVYVGETNTLAQLFEVGGAAKSNPVTTDAKGFYSFSLADGDYRIVFSSSQFATLRISVLDGAQIREDFDDLVASNTAFRNEQQAAYDAFVLSQGWNQVGAFAAGFTFTSPNQVGQDVDGNWWRWNGAFNKVVTAGTLPSSDANYKLVGDGVLRSDLASGSADIGGFTSGALAAKPNSSAQIAALSLENGFFFQVSSGQVDHFRIVEAADDGTGILLASGNYANLMLTNERKIYMSQLFVSGGDQTNLIINKLPSKIAADGINEIVLDTGDISVNGTLPFVYGKVTFSGTGKLQAGDLDNMLQRIQAERTADKMYHGEYNTGAVFNQVVKGACAVKRELRVVLFGDSISVGDDYDSGNVVAAGFVNPQGVDNIDRFDCFAAQVYTELLSALPKDVRLKFYTRSIGGLGYGNIAQPWDSIGGLFSGREQATAGKAWRDCVLDLNPDLVIHAMGMNENAESYVRDYLTLWNSYLLTQKKVGTFNQVIVTTPNPNFNDAQQFGDFRDYGLNASKFYVAHMQRYMANFTKTSLVDVAFNSYLKRYGFDPRSCTYRKDETQLTFKDGTTSKVIGVGSGLGNTEFTPDYLPIYHSTTFTITPSVSSNTAGFDFKFVAGSVILQFTNAQINLFTGVYTGSLGVVVKTEPFLMTAGWEYTFTVTVNPNGVFVYHNGNLVIVNTNAAYSATLPMYFENPASSANVTLNSGSIRGAQFARYAADTAGNGEMYGELQFELNEFGGGINHPSAVGISEIYLPPVREYFNQLLRAEVSVSTVVGGTQANEVVFVGRVAAVNYNRVSFYDRGSGHKVILDITGPSSYTVVQNTGGGSSLEVYVDTFDMSVFIKNIAAPLLQFEYTGEWLNKQHAKLGVTTPRGTLLATVP